MPDHHFFGEVNGFMESSSHFNSKIHQIDNAGVGLHPITVTWFSASDVCRSTSPCPRILHQDSQCGKETLL